MSNLRIPMMIDPTRMNTLSRIYQREVSDIYSVFKSRTKGLIHKEDALGLDLTRPIGIEDMMGMMGIKPRFAFNSSTSCSAVFNTRWKHLQTHEKIHQFNNWLVIEMPMANLLGEKSKTLHSQYISQAFSKGMHRAYDDTMGMQFVANDQEDYTLSSSNGSKLNMMLFVDSRTKATRKALFDRAYAAHSSLVGQMQHAMTTSVHQSLVSSHTPYKVASEMMTLIDRYKARALTTARTELVRAHAAGQLAMMDHLGVNQAIVIPESGDGASLCKACSSYGARPVKLSKAAGIIPMHPNCRCAWMPIKKGVGR